MDTFSINETVFAGLNTYKPPYKTIDKAAGANFTNGIQHIYQGNSTNLTADHNIVNDNSSAAIIGISLLFCVIGIVGIVGNTLIIFFVTLDKKMRHSVTNFFIMNMAISDLLIMLFGIPETVQFMLNRGWLLGLTACKVERYVLVVSLYSSVVTSVAVCVERYIAIVHPMRAHILCSRKKMALVIAVLWPSVFVLGLPVVLFNRLVPSILHGHNVTFCQLQFPGGHLRFLIPFKYTEFLLFYLIPMVLQIVCYAIIGKHLFAAGSQELHRKRHTWSDNGGRTEGISEAMKARKGVIKMLMASVTIYFLSYSPHQILLLYNTFSHAPFQQTWVFLVFVTAMGYINSAANPILYSIFSQKFRTKFKAVFLLCWPRGRRSNENRGSTHMAENVTDSGVVLSSFRQSSRSLVQVELNPSVKKAYGSCSLPNKPKRETWL